MKKLTSYVVIASFALSALAIASPENDALMAKEKAAWQSFKDKKADDFKKVVAANMMAVYEDGMSDMAKEVADMQKWDMKSFAISDYKTTANGDTVVATYKVKVEGTYDGKDASGMYNAGSVWMKGKDGSWMAIFHTNVPVAEPAG